MKASFKVSQVMTVDVEAENQRELFEKLGSIQEVFGHNVCGKCKKSILKFTVRTDKDENKYYEIRCVSCQARLQFGCHKKGGGLFPKRKDGNDNWLPDNGWMKWDRDKKEMI
jgi:RNase P subunit RPR2